MKPFLTYSRRRRRRKRCCISTGDACWEFVSHQRPHGASVSNQCGKEGFCLYSGEDGAFGGLHTGLKLYPSGSVYEDQAWAVSILMPEKTLDDAIQGNSRYLLLIALVLLAVSLLLSIFISRRYLRPVTEALSDRIKARDYAGPGENSPTSKSTT